MVNFWKNNDILSFAFGGMLEKCHKCGDAFDVLHTYLLLLIQTDDEFDLGFCRVCTKSLPFQTD